MIESMFLSVSAAGWSVEAVFAVLFADALRCFEFAGLFDVLFVSLLALSLISPFLSREKSATILSAAPCPTPWLINHVLAVALSTLESGNKSKSSVGYTDFTIVSHTVLYLSSILQSLANAVGLFSSSISPIRFNGLITLLLAELSFAIESSDLM